MITDQHLIQRAAEVAKPKRTSATVEFGSVGAALVTETGNVYLGVCIDATCGIGFCAEHSAIAAMTTNGESRIISIVAVDSKGKIIPPCGRCREFIWQMDDGNAETRIILKSGRVVTLKEILPESWLLDLPPLA